MDPMSLDSLGLIASYTRAQAIEDGQLVDATAQARQLGLRCPLAITDGAWSRCVKVPDGVLAQDEAGRLHDVLWMLMCALRGAIPSRRLDDRTIVYELHVRNDNRPGLPPRMRLKAVAGPDDQGVPCLTVMLPDET